MTQADRPTGISRDLPADYLQSGYFDGKGYMRKEVIVDDARRVASVLSNSNMTSTALRRFYGRLRAIESRFRSSKNFDKAKEDLNIFIPLAAYSVARGIPAVFQTFVERNIAMATKDEKHLRAFVMHFQSIVAFFKDRANEKRGESR